RTVSGVDIGWVGVASFPVAVWESSGEGGGLGGEAWWRLELSWVRAFGKGRARRGVAWRGSFGICGEKEAWARRRRGRRRGLGLEAQRAGSRGAASRARRAAKGGGVGRMRAR